jgi:serine phosphatase RsbU (regulator of sigma subunit)
VNAGHQEAPAVLAPGLPAERLETTGPPVGLLPVATFEPNRTRIPPGTLFCAWSDGIPEAHLRGEEDSGDQPAFFGDTVTMLDLLGRGDEPVAAVAERIFTRVDAFLGGAKAPDDRTLLLLRRL